MIIEFSGLSVTHTESSATATMIVATTGTAYARKGKIKSIMRFYRKMVTPVKSFVKKIYVAIVSSIMSTKTGKPTSIDPPLDN